MLRISTDFLIPDTPARSLRSGNCTRDREIGFVRKIMSSEERIGKCQQNSGRIQPKANGIRVNFIVGVTTLTFNDPDFKKRNFVGPGNLKTRNPLTCELNHRFAKHNQLSRSPYGAFSCQISGPLILGPYSGRHSL